MTRHCVDIPDEPPPAYEAIVPAGGAARPSQPAPLATAATEPPAAATADATQNLVSPAIAPQSTDASTNPFLSVSEGGTAAASSSGSSNPFHQLAPNSPHITDAAQPPALPLRRYNTGATSATQPLSPTPTGSGLGRAPSNGSSIYASASAGGARTSNDASRPESSTGTSYQRPPSFVSATSSASGSHPAGSASPGAAVYQPPPGRPLQAGPASPSPASPPSASRPTAQPGSRYRPTTVPTPGQPLLRNGKLLVYPKNWAGCHKCGDTGYRHNDPTHPCHKCWDKYGKTFGGALSYSVGLNDPASKLQKPLPVVGVPTGSHYAQPSDYGPPGGGAWPPGPSHGYVPGGYPGAAGGSRPSWSPQQQQHHGYPHGPNGAYSAPVRPPPAPAVRRSDAETEASKMPDAPPTYNDASNVGERERLPAQYPAPAAPPPGVGGRPMHSPPPHGPPGQFGQGCLGYGYGAPGPHAPMVRPMVANRFASNVPPGALIVMPGDPRIGGRLCYECGGRGLTESFWFGDETCLRCRGSGRIF